MSADTRPVLLLVLAKTCGGCIKLKQTILPYLEPEVRRDGKVRLVKVEIPDMIRHNIPRYLKEGGIPDSAISEIIPYLEWFPNFLIISGSSWNRGRGLEISTFNGMKTPRGWEGNPAIPVTKDNLYKWINAEAEKGGRIPLGTLAQGNVNLVNQPVVHGTANQEKYVQTIGSINIVPRRF